MEARTGKALVSKSRVLPGVKRKRPSLSGASSFARASHKALPECRAINSPIQKLGKRRKVDGSQSKYMSCRLHLKRSLLQCYSNFMKTGVPKRLMFYQNGEWTDFSQDLLALIRNDLRVKKAVVEVEFGGHCYVLDFLHMFLLDMKTGMRQPIAWIDEGGGCFFPEVYSDDGSYECSDKVYGKETGYMVREAPETREIKLQLEIGIDVDHSKLKEHSGESDALVKHIQIAQEPHGGHYLVEVEDSCDRHSGKKMDEAIVQNKEITTYIATGTESAGEKLDPDIVHKIFAAGMSPFE